MAISATYIDGYVRAMKISIGGKSDEAQLGASMMVQNLLRYAHGLKSKDQTYEAMLGLLDRLAAELPIARQSA